MIGSRLYWTLCRWAWASIFLLMADGALAHSSSNSYLTLSTQDQDLMLRADINLRDIDLIFDLDEDRDGQVTWGETHARASELDTWLRQGIALSESGQACTLGLLDLQASQHADGTYLSAQWPVVCPGLMAVSDLRLKLRYGLIFEQDALHRGLLKVDLPNFQSSAILSPERPEIQVAQSDNSALRVFGR
ncbi:MAG: hypothetical protein RL459_1435, partial [Pseudomonadota bacterium]